MKKTFLVVVMIATGSFVFAQRKSTPTAPKDTTPVAKPMPPQVPKATKPGPKPFKEIITDKSISKTGLFTVHKVEDKYYFEVPNNLLGKEIMCVTRYSKVPGGAGIYGGEVANQQTLKFEKGPNDNIFIRTVTLISAADSTQKISTAVNNSYLDAIAAAFDIKAYGKDSTSSIIEVSDFFKGDQQIVGINASSKRRFSLAMLAPDRSFVQSINTYPINTEVKTVKTYISSPAPTAAAIGGQRSSAGFAAANDAGAVTFELNTSFILLPEKPMAKRAWDKRVGYFPDNYVEYSDNQQRVEDKTFAVRWRLEPKPEDVAKWKKGELVEPIKPLVYYIDPATPPNWVPYLIAGVNDWQKAFEKAGFKNAIMAKEWPKNDSTMSLEDARFSVIRYFASDIENAYGPNIHDPRTGEILESHIGWYHNVMKLVHDWYMIQTAAVDPRARKMEFDTELMGQLIRFVSSHEIGHTLGLLHNMGSSSRTPVEKLRDKAWVEANGHTASIMDYARFNYVAQPEDNISEKGLFPRIGEYDEWAIQWGYGYIPGETEEQQKLNSDKLITKTLAENPRKWFGTYELGNSVDPRTQSEDLSDNVMKANDYGIKNLKRIIVNLPEWTKEEGENYDNLNEIYGQLVGQYNRYVNHVIRNVGGIYETFKTTSQPGDVFEFVPKATQKEAFTFINNHVFTTPSWLLDKNILNKIQNPISIERVQGIQVNTLNGLLDPSRLTRMIVSANRYGATNVYLFNDLMDDTKNAIWSEAAQNKPVDAYRRALQKAHVEKLIDLLNFKPQTVTVSTLTVTTGPDIKNTDIVSYVRGQLKALQTQLTNAAAVTTDKLTKFHYQDIVERIKQALNPR